MYGLLRLVSAFALAAMIIALGQAIAEAQGHRWPDARALRDGPTGPRGDAEVGLSAARGGEVVGEHTVYFFGPGERLELTHRATDRTVFAHGALRAARWLAGRAPGRYDMDAMLGAMLGDHP